MLKQHLDMIGRNEPVQRKAKFWQSYVRALKGKQIEDLLKLFLTMQMLLNYYIKTIQNTNLFIILILI